MRISDGGSLPHQTAGNYHMNSVDSSSSQLIQSHHNSNTYVYNDHRTESSSSYNTVMNRTDGHNVDLYAHSHETEIGTKISVRTNLDSDSKKEHSGSKCPMHRG